jgi:ABC-type lipoprotein export system ATPase subunit
MLLKLENINKSFLNPNGNIKRDVLKDLNLELNKGEIISITGPSGSGKTTLLNLIALFDKTDSGKIIFNSENISDYSESQINNYRNKKIGFVFQQHNLLPQLSLLENILLPALISGENEAEYLKRAENLMSFLGVDKLRNQKPAELSGGECQRAAIIRALINNPEILLADEPTGALDEDNAAELMKLLHEINKEFKIAIILVTHDNFIAEKCDKIFNLKNGKLLNN